MIRLERIVKRFYDELDNGNIMGRKCTRCGYVEFPPVLMCNNCSGQEMEWVKLSGKATLTEFVQASMLSSLPDFAKIAPYGLGTVKIEEGTELNAVIRGISPANADSVRAALPAPLEAEILQQDGYKTVIFRLTKEY